MNDAMAVRVLQRLGDFVANAKRFRKRQPFAVFALN